MYDFVVDANGTVVDEVFNCPDDPEKWQLGQEVFFETKLRHPSPIRICSFDARHFTVIFEYSSTVVGDGPDTHAYRGKIVEIAEVDAFEASERIQEYVSKLRENIHVDHQLLRDWATGGSLEEKVAGLFAAEFDRGHTVTIVNTPDGKNWTVEKENGGFRLNRNP